MSSVARSRFEHQYGTAGRKKSQLRPIGPETGTSAVKPGLDLSVFHECLPPEAFNGFSHDGSVSRSARPASRSLVDPDGSRLDGAAAHRQFRLGRSPSGRFRSGLIGAGGALWPIAARAELRGNGWSRPWSRSGRCAGAHRPAYRWYHRRSALRGFRPEWGSNAPRRMFVFLQNQAFGSIPLVFAIFVAAHSSGPTLRRCRIISVRLILLAALPARRSPTRSSKRSAPIPPTGPRSATSGCGARRAIPTTSSNGSAGSPIPSSRSRSTIRFISLELRGAAGAGLHVLDPRPRHRHPAAGAADAALARRALSRLSGAHQRVLPTAAALVAPDYIIVR